MERRLPRGTTRIHASSQCGFVGPISARFHGSTASLEQFAYFHLKAALLSSITFVHNRALSGLGKAVHSPADHGNLEEEARVGLIPRIVWRGTVRQPINIRLVANRPLYPGG